MRKKIQDSRRRKQDVSCPERKAKDNDYAQGIYVKEDILLFVYGVLVHGSRFNN